MTLQDKAKAIEEMGLDEETYGELLKCFIPEADETIGSLDAVVAADDFGGIARLGHGLKGMAGNLRIYPIQEAARLLETQAKEGQDKGAIITIVAVLKQAMEDLRKMV